MLNDHVFDPFNHFVQVVEKERFTDELTSTHPVISANLFLDRIILYNLRKNIISTGKQEQFLQRADTWLKCKPNGTCRYKKEGVNEQLFITVQYWERVSATTIPYFSSVSVEFTKLLPFLYLLRLKSSGSCRHKNRHMTAFHLWHQAIKTSSLGANPV